MIHWEEPQDKDESDKRRSWWYKPRSTDIEQTSYALLAKLQFGGRNAVQQTIPIVRWLSKQRNSLGGWSSTQVSGKLRNPAGKIKLKVSKVTL